MNANKRDEDFDFKASLQENAMNANKRDEDFPYDDFRASLREIACFASALVIDVSHLRDELEVWRSNAVYPGCNCFYYDSEQDAWLDAVFHQWCTTLMPPNAIVHSLETGKCFLVKIEDLRFPVVRE